MRVSMGQFETAIEAALATIPDRFRAYLEDIEFVAARRSPDGSLGLYEGGTSLEVDGLPPRITLFKEAHESACRSLQELVEEVRRTVLHEVGHHFGMDEWELPY